MVQYVYPLVGWHLLIKNTQIAFDLTTLDAAKSSIVFGVTKSVSTAGRAVSPVVTFLDSTDTAT